MGKFVVIQAVIAHSLIVIKELRFFGTIDESTGKQEHFFTSQEKKKFWLYKFVSYD